MIRELSAKEVKEVSGGKADFSKVSSSVTSTAQIVDGNTQRARLIIMWRLLR